MTEDLAKAQSRLAALKKIQKAYRNAVVVNVSCEADVKRLIDAIKASKASHITLNITEVKKPTKAAKK